MFLVKRHNQGRKEERVANEVKDGRLVLLSKLLLLMPCDKVAIDSEELVSKFQNGKVHSSLTQI